MRVMTKPMATVGLAALWAVTAGSPAQAQETERAITGVWALNQDLSNDPQEAVLRGRPDGQGARGRGGSGAFGGPGSGGRGGFGGGRGGGFGGGRGGDRPDPEEMAATREAMQSAMKDLMSAPRRMTIEETQRGVLLTYDDGCVVWLIPDDQEHAGIAGNAMEVRRRTKWVGEKLVAQIDLQSRIEFKLEQTYEARLDGQQLVITSTFEGERFGNDEEHSELTPSSARW